MIDKYQTNPNKRKLLKIGLQNRDVIKNQGNTKEQTEGCQGDMTTTCNINFKLLRVLFGRKLIKLSNVLGIINTVYIWSQQYCFIFFINLIFFEYQKAKFKSQRQERLCIPLYAQSAPAYSRIQYNRPSSSSTSVFHL